MILWCLCVRNSMQKLIHSQFFYPMSLYICPLLQSSVTTSFFCSYSISTCHYFQSVGTLPLCTCSLFWIQLCHEMPLTAKLRVLAGQVTLWEIAFGQSLLKSPSPARPQQTASAKKMEALTLTLTSIWLLSRKVVESGYCHVFLCRRCKHVFFFFLCVNVFLTSKTWKLFCMCLHCWQMHVCLCVFSHHLSWSKALWCLIPRCRTNSVSLPDSLSQSRANRFSTHSPGERLFRLSWCSLAFICCPTFI